MQMLLKSSDEYAKILIIVWMKLREIYLESDKKDKVSLNKRIDSLIKFCRTVRKRCERVRKLPKLSKYLRTIEYKFRDGKETIDKISGITAILRMLDLPKPVNNLIDSLGLGNMEDNEFANVINELFEENGALEQLQSIDDHNNEEGTLVDYINKKYNKNIKKDIKIKKIETIQEEPVNQIPVNNEVISVATPMIIQQRNQNSSYQYIHNNPDDLLRVANLSIPNKVTQTQNYYPGNPSVINSLMNQEIIQTRNNVTQNNVTQNIIQRRDNINSNNLNTFERLQRTSISRPSTFDVPSYNKLNQIALRNPTLINQY